MLGNIAKSVALVLAIAAMPVQEAHAVRQMGGGSFCTDGGDLYSYNAHYSWYFGGWIAGYDVISNSPTCA